MRFEHWFYELPLRLRSLFRSEDVDAELDEELRDHLDRHVQALIAEGMAPDEAWRTAKRTLGPLLKVKEECRDTRGVRMIQDFWQDLRYGARLLSRNRLFTAVAVLTLALGIGANSAIFSVINGVLIRPLAFKEPARLVRIYTTAFNGVLTKVTSRDDFLDWQAQNDVFDQLAIYAFDGNTVTGIGEPRRVDSADAGPGFFQLFGVTPLMGRTFSDGECVPGSGRVVMLGEGFWKQQFGSDPNIVGRSIAIDGQEATVIGVIPDRFELLVGRVQLWLPFLHVGEGRGNRDYWAVGRLKPGVKITQAGAQMAGIAARLEELYHDSNYGWGATVVSLQESIVGDARLMLLILLAAVGLVLLIACSNVANLLLARAATRSQEIALRSALGAAPARVIRQLLTEGLLLSALDCGLAILLAIAGTRLLTRMNTHFVPRIDEVSLDFTVIGFTLLLSFAATFIFGLAPALRMSATGFAEALKEAGRGARGSKRQRRIRDLLVVAQLSVSLVLLIACGLLICSFYQLASVDPGFDTRGLVKAQVVLPDSKYQRPAALTSFYDELMSRLGSLPGAQSVAVCTTVPLTGKHTPWNGVVPDGRPYAPEETTTAQYRKISPGFFSTMRIPLLAGRDFDQYDAEGSQQVTILSQSMAHRLWPDEDPVGKRIFREPGHPILVVGVAGDIKLYGLDNSDDIALYVPFPQAIPGFMSIVARSASSAGSLAGGIQEIVHSIDKDLPVFDVAAMDDVRSDTLAGRRFNMFLLSMFSGLALLLSLVGTYAVISYSVAERFQEIGIRMALGAARRHVVCMIVGQALRHALLGMTLGLLSAWAITRVMESLLFKVSPTDHNVFAFVSIFLVAVSLTAAYIPARKATRIDPLVALRYE